MSPITVARGRRAPALAVGALALAAWLTLFVWERSEYRAFLDLGELDRISVDGGPVVMLLVAGWAVMVAAMMLPTTIPLVVMFEGMTRSRPAQAQLLALLLAGYLVVWIGFGFLVHATDFGVHSFVEHASWLEDNEWMIAAATFALAGAYQFSRLKYRCQRECRSPRMFLIQRWRGGNEHRQALTIGVQHGIFCVGCCWTLMLVLMALGTFSIGWMLLVGAVMAVEKNFPFGHRLRTPLGAVLLVIALVIAGIGLLGPPSPGHHHQADQAVASAG